MGHGTIADGHGRVTFIKDTSEKKKQIKPGETMKTKSFSLGAILSIAGDALMCDIGQVYEILNFMTADNLFTHQLPRACKECRPYILEQFPFLKGYAAIAKGVTRENYAQILSECKKKWGKEHAVGQIPKDDHTVKNPITELGEMVGPEKVIVINVGEKKC